MKNRKPHHLLAVLCVLAAALSSGCLKAELILDLDKNGSGSIEADYSISETAITQIKSMVKLSHQLENMSLGKSKEPSQDPEILLFLDPDENRIRTALQQYAKSGLKVEKLRVRSQNSERSVNLRLEFDDLAEVAKADFFADIGFSLYRRKSGDLLFHRKSMNENNTAKGPALDEDSQQLIAPILHGFDVTVKIHTPGRVLESNADSSAINSASWTFDQDRDPKAFQRLQNQSFMILMDGSGVRIPDIKIVTTPAKK